MTNPNSLTINDYWLAFLKAGYPGNANDPSNVTIGQGIKTSTPAPGSFDSVVAGGSTAASPGAGTTIVSCTAPTTGRYLVKAYGGFGSTAEATTLDNIAINRNATLLTKVPVVNVANTESNSIEFYVSASASDVFTIYVNAAGSAGSIYKAWLCITRVA